MIVQKYLRTTIIVGMLLWSSIALAQGTASENTENEVKVNLNFASLEELKTLEDIDSKTAQAIMEKRPYTSLEELLNVEGITRQTLEKIKERITVAKLNINTATVPELTALPGIDVELAEKIIEERPYEIIEELLKFKGFGEKELNKIQDLIEAKPLESEDADDKKGWQTRDRNRP